MSSRSLGSMTLLSQLLLQTLIEVGPSVKHVLTVDGQLLRAHEQAGLPFDLRHVSDILRNSHLRNYHGIGISWLEHGPRNVLT